MSGTRKSGSRKSTAPAKKNTVKRSAEKQSGGIWAEVRLVLVLIVSVILFCSNFGFGGTVGGAMSSFL